MSASAEFRLKSLAESASQVSKEDDLQPLRTALANNERHIEMLRRSKEIAGEEPYWDNAFEIEELISMQKQYLSLLTARIEQVTKEKRKQVSEVKKEIAKWKKKQQALPKEPRPGQAPFEFDREVREAEEALNAWEFQLGALETELKGGD
jgi:hypothetical protein